MADQMAPSSPSIISRHVAVIGAVAAGLVTARELRREGHSVVVFERQNQVGGTWIYTDHVEPDPLSVDPTRPIVYSSVYGSLRTNLPRECMGFRDFPFVIRPGVSRDPRRFPSHGEVLAYLQDFAKEFAIEEMIRFETVVLRVSPVEESGGEEEGLVKWRIESTEKDKKVRRDEIYDAVVVCNGHYIEPRLADIPGISSWPGKEMHSHNYRIPEPFKDQVVVLIGSSASVDISRDIAGVAKEVHVASWSNAADTWIKQTAHIKLWMHSMIECVLEDGSVVFQNGKTILADVIMHCTGYKYHFPFLDTNGSVTVDDNRVGPLYKHIFSPTFAPSLSFIGIAWKVLPFHMFELQSKWIAGVLSSRIRLPSKEDMMVEIKTIYATFEAQGVPKRYTHYLGFEQFEYFNWLASQNGCQGTEDWRKEMCLTSFVKIMEHPETYRDEWEDHHLVSQAYQDFSLLNKI